MTTNEIAIGQMVTDYEYSRWWEAPGMLGLGPIGSLVVTILLFFIIAYVFGVIDQYRKDKTWLIPNARYWMEIGRGLGISMKTWAGIATPRQYVERSDGAYAKLNMFQVNECLAHARHQMDEMGITLENYRSRSFDCENYAMTMASLASHYAAHNYEIGRKGIPFFIFGYTRDSDRAKHVLVKAVVDGKTPVFFEAFPEEKYAEPKKLSKQEIASCDLDFG